MSKLSMISVTSIVLKKPGKADSPEMEEVMPNKPFVAPSQEVFDSLKKSGAAIPAPADEAVEEEPKEPAKKAAAKKAPAKEPAKTEDGAGDETKTKTEDGSTKDSDLV